MCVHKSDVIINPKGTFVFHGVMFAVCSNQQVVSRSPDRYFASFIGDYDVTGPGYARLTNKWDFRRVDCEVDIILRLARDVFIRSLVVGS